ncbi:Holliday junction resolvase RuvX [Legionella sp. W05-934-2]|jgi:putative Holliday junction resolvase|uniref:Holliday junction resolvase RuvX n=1 Tax=Legionella sp. W05-934-2 TaxID=1198649 RepID=UPI00346251C6
MSNVIYLGFDFGYSRIGVAVGQSITASARPLTTLKANQGQPDWQEITKLIKQWRPAELVVGLPTTIAGKAQYTTDPAKQFAKHLREDYGLPVHLVDERLTTKEARANLFDVGGYKELKKAEIDAHAAALILEQWLRDIP